MKTKMDYKALWLGAFERLAVKEGLFQPGNVDWHTATHLYNQKISPEQAVERMTDTRNEQERAG